MSSFKHKKIIGLAGFSCLLVLSACSRQEDAALPEPVSEPDILPLAQVGDAVLTEEDFQYEIQRRQETGRPVTDKNEVLQDLILRQAMLQEASRSGAMDDPAAKRALENQMLSTWLEQTLHTEKQNVRVTDEELREQYDAQIESFTQSAKVRLAVLIRTVNSSDEADSVESLKNALTDARERYLADPDAATRGGRIPGFGEVAVNATEHTVSRYRGGDLGWMSVDEPPSRWPAKVIKQGLSLEPGQVSEVLVVEDALYLVMNSGVRPAQVTPFEEAVVALRRPLIRKKQNAIEETFTSDLLAAFEVTLNTDKVAALSVPQPVQNDPLDLQPLTGPSGQSLAMP